MPFLNQRHREPEIMDQPDLDPSQHIYALQGLERLNGWSGSAGILWPRLRDLARRQGRTLRVLDLATGGGDVPLRLWQRALRAGVALQLEGCDVSPRAVEHAQANARKHLADVRFFVHDALLGPALEGYDVMMCSLFLHHLDAEPARAFLERLGRQALCMVLVSDLIRAWPGYLLAQVASRLLTRSSVVHTDGPLSVQGAFTRAELRNLAEQAGLHGATISWRWPWRMLLTWRRPLDTFAATLEPGRRRGEHGGLVLVVGAGPAGATAARELARGARGRGVAGRSGHVSPLESVWLLPEWQRAGDPGARRPRRLGEAARRYFTAGYATVRAGTRSVFRPGERRVAVS